MNRLKLAMPAVIFIGGLIAGATLTFAKPEYTKKEKKPCAYCHVTATSKELNAVGKCYKEKKSLEGCQPSKKG